MSIPSLKAIVGHAIITKDFPPDPEKQLPEEVFDYLTIFRENIIENPKIIFDNAHKVEVKSLDDKNPYENIRLELIKIRILNKSISTSKKSLNSRAGRTPIQKHRL